MTGRGTTIEETETAIETAIEIETGTETVTEKASIAMTAIGIAETTDVAATVIGTTVTATAGTETPIETTADNALAPENGRTDFQTGDVTLSRLQLKMRKNKNRPQRLL